MESSIRDIFIFWKLSCLEEDNALFKKLMPWSYILNIDRGPYGPIAVFEISWSQPIPGNPPGALGGPGSAAGGETVRNLLEMEDGSK